MTARGGVLRARAHARVRRAGGPERLEGEVGLACAAQVNPNIKKEKWTEEEDEALVALVAEHGNAWADIARRLDGRTDQQCMGRWRRHLDPAIRRDAWATR